MEHQQHEGSDEETTIFEEGNIPKIFQDLDQTFRCGICFSLFDKAVTIKECGHTFCSVCIRSHWVAVRRGAHRQERACPLCRTVVNTMDVDKALVMNRSIQDSVKSFKQILLNHHRSSKDVNENSPPPRSQITRQRRKIQRPSENNLDCEDKCTRGKRKNIGNGYEDKKDLPIQRKMQSRNYSRMKKTELQKLCIEYNIPKTGNEQELIDRMRKFQSMWNAEVDSIEPKTPSDLAVELKNELHAQRDERKRALITGAAGDMNCIKKLNENMKSGNITSGNAKFDKKINSNFDSLVKQLRDRKEKESGSSTIAVKAPCDGRNDCGENDSHKRILSDDCEDQTSSTKPSRSSPDVIDIEACPDVPHSGTRNPVVKSIKTPRSSSRESVSSSIPTPSAPLPPTTSYRVNKSKRTKIVDEQSNRTRRSTPSPLVSMNRIDWACDRCTFVNNGMDYMCKICGNRRA